MILVVHALSRIGTAQVSMYRVASKQKRKRFNAASIVRCVLFRVLDARISGQMDAVALCVGRPKRLSRTLHLPRVDRSYKNDNSNRIIMGALHHTLHEAPADRP